MTELEKTIMQQADADYAYLSALRREFHRHPEISEEEYWTAARIEEELDKIPLTHFRLCKTGVVAVVEGEGSRSSKLSPEAPAPCLALRADIDALPISEKHESSYKSEIPGRMHACGHDIHLTSLIGAARILHSLRDRFFGRILLIFQPGEENGYGGRKMVEEGAVKEATRCFGFHIAPELRVGTMAIHPGPNNASVDWFRMTIRGTGTHVAYPHQGADALYAAAQIVTSSQALLTRLQDPLEPLLLGFGSLKAGVAYNIVAEEAVLEGTIRALNPKTRLQICRRLEELAENTARLFGCSAEMEWEENGAMLINTPEAVKEARGVAASLFGAESLVDRKPSLIGDDMSEFINAVSGCYAFIGTQNPDRAETAHPLHHACLDVDEEVFRISVPLLSAYALEYMRGEV